ncbi:MAG: acyl-CoA thioesterase [Marinospirillum sp.]|uniref:acyl-CoA thioesterase n=1 Tax=Marinospirillum sp. TaxID=2183934 RepID=UPI0019EAB5F1|nr:thioesterase family protein [Marinospirillum sp.]MBE0506867.1 acyl-CoA thioesterase [Marinospirillum sp.]
MKNSNPLLDDPRFQAEVEIDIAFHDVDSMEVVWHGNYFRYLEIAREKLLRQLGYGYREMREHGHMWPIIDTRVKYSGAVCFEQKIRVVAFLLEYENRLKIGYKLFDVATGKKTTEAWTIQVAVDAAKKEMLFVSPDILFERMGLPR